MLASTTSAASFSISSLCSPKGERGRAIRPVRVDSRIPKGPISFRKESILEGLAELREKESELFGIVNGSGGKRLTLRQCSCWC